MKGTDRGWGDGVPSGVESALHGSRQGCIGRDLHLGHGGRRLCRRAALLRPGAGAGRRGRGGEAELVAEGEDFPIPVSVERVAMPVAERRGAGQRRQRLSQRQWR